MHEAGKLLCYSTLRRRGGATKERRSDEGEAAAARERGELRVAKLDRTERRPGEIDLTKRAAVAGRSIIVQTSY